MLITETSIVTSTEAVLTFSGSIDLLDKIVKIVSTFLGIVLTILGFSFTHNYKKKREDAVFGFYAKLKVFLVQLQPKIGNDIRNIFYCRYQGEQYKQKALANNEKMQLQQHIEKILDFLHSSNNQIPASSKWHENMDSLLKFLIQYSTLDKNPLVQPKNNGEEAKRAYKKINQVIEEMLKEIKEQQDKLLPGYFWKKLCNWLCKRWLCLGIWLCKRWLGLKKWLCKRWSGLKKLRVCRHKR